MRRLVLKNFRIIDEDGDFTGSIVVENGCIKNIVTEDNNLPGADITIDGGGFPPSAVLMPAFIDLHAHFREPGFPEKETVQSAALAAVSGGYTTVVCMANTKPVIDTYVKTRALKDRGDALGLVDLYPVLSLTKNMEGRELSGITDLFRADRENGYNLPLMLSEDGKDVDDDDLFLAAMGEAKRLGVPVSCHCDFGGENDATARAIALGKKAACHIHIAHVSTAEAAEIIRTAKKDSAAADGFSLTCEAAPHHIGATEEDARRMGGESFGRVNPPLRSEADRRAIIAAIDDGTIDAIATDHAPHSEDDKAAGAPGFSGLETSFAACLTYLVSDDFSENSSRQGSSNLRFANAEEENGLAKSILPPRAAVPPCDDSGKIMNKLSRLLSASPARIIGLSDRGRIAPGLRADFVIVDTGAAWTVNTERFKSRGKCSPFAGRELRGKVLMTFNAGRIVYGGGIA